MKAKNLLAGIEGNVSDVINNIDLVMASNTQELCVDSNNISKKGELKMHNIDNENYIEEDRWDYSNECNEWEGGGLRNNYKPKQNRMLESYVW